MILFDFISSFFFEVLLTAGNRACALYLRNRELHPASGSPGEGETEASFLFFFLFHFCLIPLVSEGITGPFMIEGGALARWMLPTEAVKTASGSAAHGGSHVGRNGVWFVCFCLLILNPQEEDWPVFPHECVGMHPAIIRTFWFRV